MTDLTPEWARKLHEAGWSFAAIGRKYGVGREWARRLARRDNVTFHCRRCHEPLPSPRALDCPDCHRKQRRLDAQRRRARAREQRLAAANDEALRPVLREARDFFAAWGCDVQYNAQAKRAEPELLVNGHRVKVTRASRSGRGLQGKLRPSADVEYFYLGTADPEDRPLVIPAAVIEKPVSYLAADAPLMRYGTEEWLEEVRGEICSQKVATK